MNKEETISSQRLMTNAGRASVFVSLTLVVIKVYAWTETGSVAVFASLIDSGMDCFASIINLIAIRFSLEPPDKEHRFGHGKAEAVAGLAQASFIAGSSILLLFNIVDRLLNPRALEQFNTGIVIMLVSLLLTIILVLYQRYVIRKTDSTAIKADALHYLTDILSNSAALLALYMASLGWVKLDILIGVVIAAYIFHSAVTIVRESMSVLLDRELEDSVKKQMFDAINSHEQVRGLHDFRTRKSGLINYIQFHLELDDELTLMEAHDVSEEVEQIVFDKFPNTEVIVHIDPKSLYENKAREGFEEAWNQK